MFVIAFTTLYGCPVHALHKKEATNAAQSRLPFPPLFAEGMPPVLAATLATPFPQDAIG